MARRTGKGFIKLGIAFFSIILLLPVAQCYSNAQKNVVDFRMEFSPYNQAGDPGQTIFYSMIITNSGSAPDSYNFTVSSVNGFVTIFPNAGSTGTVGIGKSFTQMLSVTISLSAPVGTDTIEAVGVSETSGKSRVARANVTINPSYSVEVTAPSFLSGAPGEALNYIFVVRNRGNGADSFILNAKSEHNWNVTLQPAKTDWLSPNTTQDVMVTVHIPDLNYSWKESDYESNGTFAGSTDTIVLRATSVSSGIEGSAWTKTTIELAYGVKLKATPSTAEVEYVYTASDDRRWATYMVTAYNLCNHRNATVGTARIHLDNKTLPIGWDAYFDRYEYSVPARQSYNFILNVGASVMEVAGNYYTEVEGRPIPPPGFTGHVLKDSINVETTVKLHSYMRVIAPLHFNVKVTNVFYCNFTVENLGNGPDTFFLSAWTFNGWNAYPNETYVQIESGLTKTTWVTVEVPSKVPALHVEKVVMRARSTNNQSVYDEDIVEVTIVFVYRFGVSCSNSTHFIPPGKETSFAIAVTNFGSENVDIELNSQNVPSGWTTRFSKTVVTLGLGAVEGLTFGVTSPANAKLHETANITVVGTARSGTEEYTSSVSTVTIVHMLFIREGDYLIQKAKENDPDRSVAYTLEVINVPLPGAVAGPDSIFISRSEPPPGWLADIFVKGENKGPNYTFLNMAAYESQDVELRVNIPRNAHEGDYAEIKIVAKSLTSNQEAKTDTVVAVTSVVYLDLAVARLTLPDRIMEDDNVNFTATISAGSSEGGRSRDATNVIVKFEIWEGKTIIKTIDYPIFTLSKGGTRDVSVSWKAPRMPWFDKIHRYAVNVSAYSDTESPTANKVNNVQSKETILNPTDLRFDAANRVSFALNDATFPLYAIVLCIIAAVCCIVCSLFVVRVLGKTKQPRMRHYIAYPLYALALGLLAASLFMLQMPEMKNLPDLANYVGYFIIVFFMVLFFILPLSAYNESRSYIVACVAGLLSPIVFVALIGLGDIGYAGDILLNGGMLVVVIGCGLIGPIYGIISHLLWNYTNKRIGEVEALIRSIRKGSERGSS